MLLGRRVEQARLAEALERARAGRSVALIIHGEPGIGKTSLIEQTAASAVDFVILRARPLEGESELPFAGLSDLLRPIFHLLDRIPGAQEAAIRGALALGPPVPGDRFAVAAATLSLLAAASDVLPVLALVDDAHWLDQPSCEALLFAARRLGSEGVVFVFGMRDRDWLHTSGIEELDLRGLALDDAVVLVDDVGVPVAAAVRERLASECSGNPLAILEAVATLSAAQLDGSAPIDRPLAVGAALEQAFAERLVGLPVDTQRALLIVAASTTGDAREIAQALAVGGLGASALEPAERDGVIALTGNRVDFRHPLVRSAAYHLHDLAQRRAAHRALAEALGDDADGRAAWHWAAATVEPNEEVATMLESAAAAALARSAYSAAARAYEAAAAISLGADDRVRRAVGAGQALWLGGEAARAVALLEGVVDLAVDPIARADVQQLRAAAMAFTRPVVETHALLVAEARRVRPHDVSRAAALLAAAASACTMSADIERAIETARAAVNMADGDGGPAAMLASFALGHALALRGDVHEAIRVLEPALHIPELVDTVGGLTLPSVVAWQSFVWMERWAAARGRLERVISTARAAGAPTILVFPLAVLSELDFRQGKIAAAYATAAESVQLAAETGQIGAGAYSLVTLARVEAVLGREHECRTHVEAALEAARPTGTHSIEIYAAAVLGLLELSVGRPERAATHLAECRREEHQHGVLTPTVVPWAADLVEAYARTGAIADAQPALRALEQRADATDSRWGRAAGARCRGLLASEQDYEREFAAALEIHSDESAYERARTQLCLGMRRRRSRRRSAARSVLHEALAYFEAVGAEPWANQTRSELRATGETPAPATDTSLGVLTQQELQVAMIVAKGATNREVAASLFLSPKTIEFHLGNTYRKLGIRSRTELVRRVAGLA